MHRLGAGRASAVQALQPMERSSPGLSSASDRVAEKSASTPAHSRGRHLLLRIAPHTDTGNADGPRAAVACACIACVGLVLRDLTPARLTSLTAASGEPRDVPRRRRMLYAVEKTKLRESVEGNDGALTAPAGAERGGYARGQGLQASPC
eukprot:scaffold10948_cov132-Isochrysis_galbana.AAC.5